MVEYNGTSFFKIYCRFLDKITDEMYMELSLEDTLKNIESIFQDSLAEFDFPKFRINSYDKDKVTSDAIDEEGNSIVTGAFEDTLTNEEEDLIAEIMLNQWYKRQLATTRLLQMRYSTSDFKQTSQAAHLQRLSALIKDHNKEIYRKQRMYHRRKIDEDGMYYADYDALAGVGPRKYKRIWTRLGEVKL